MTKKIKKDWRLSPDVVEIISTYADTHTCSYAEALERIVLEHNKRGSDEDLVKQLLQGMDKHYEDFFTRVRLGIWNADVNSQVILEILNTLLYSKSIPVAIFTDENPTPVFLESQKHIRDKIRAYSNKKTEKKRKDLLIKVK